MARTKTTKIRAKNQITGQHKWFTEKVWGQLTNMSRMHNGKIYPRQGWVQIAEKRAPAPEAAKQALSTAKLSEEEKIAARKAEAARAAKVVAEKQAAAKAAAAAAAKEANAAKTSDSKSSKKSK